MKKLRRNFPIWCGVILTAMFPIAALIGALPLLLWEDVWAYGEYLPQLVSELPILLIGVLLTLLFRMGYVFRPGGRRLGQYVLPMLPLLLFYTYGMVGGILLESYGSPLAQPSRVLWFVLCMLSIGVTEELFFRGLITRMIFEKYGRNSLGVWLSVLTSSTLFGLVHLMNALGGAVELGSVLVQVVGAAGIGLCFAAIYLRTNSLWAVALLHGYMDFCALAPSGLFEDLGLAESLGGYSAAQLIGALFYAALALFLLRPSQMKKILAPRRQREPREGEIIKLMLAVMLLSGVFSAVLVLSI